MFVSIFYDLIAITLIANIPFTNTFTFFMLLRTNNLLMQLNISIINIVFKQIYKSSGRPPCSL